MNEFELIARITKDAPKTAPDLVRGVGDDCAVIAGPEGKDWLVTQDGLMEGIHFRREWTDMASLGRKALAVNLSDIAAMGGRPRFYAVTLGLPADLRAKCAEQIFAGMHELASEFGVGLIGGDTVRSASGLALSITAIGEVPSERAVYRCTARAGDVVYLTGTAGSAALGLACLHKGDSEEESAPFVNRHKDPEPRVKAGELLGECGMVTSMIDVSDGVMADLGHIAGCSGVGFRIELIRIPVDDSFRALARKIGANPAELAISGGEDYELLFTVRPAHAEEFEKKVLPGLGVGAARIGVIVREKKRREVTDVDGKFFVPAMAGFDHFE
jgi:thiamine-monophosphate kinase